ncbi:TetR family transcriptional regulator [Corynebacterium glyciniphilum]|uniref:TetR family transcriptional regulator n=1 Tax=Corynebacterium glyciniphilum TaxID=1404244 RepID=UPI003DA02A39
MTDPVELPSSHRRYDCPPDEYRLILDTAIPELVRSGLSADTRDIAVGAGVPPTHPLLRDTRVLYDEAIRFAFRRLWPRPEDLDVERLVPAEAVRSLVRTAYRRHRANPDAVRLIISENVLSRTHLEGRSDVLESSPVVLQIDRVLMRGQDYGAFRPGISAEDVYVLITSLCCFPASQGTMFQLLYGTDMDHAATVDGLEKLACDTVLAFLTTSMPTTQGSSYTHAAPTTTTPSSVSASLYTAGDGGSVEEVVTYRPEDLPDFTEPEDAPDAQPFPSYDAYADDLSEQGLDDRDGADDDDGTVDDHIAALYDD